MNLPVPSTASQVVHRMRLLTAQRIPYQLHNTPKWKPSELPRIGTPGNCTVAVCWGLGIEIFHKLYGWFNSDGIVKDAKLPGGLFTRTERPLVGGIVVYPWKGKQAGHAAIITAVTADGKLPLTVIDCSPANGRSDSVRERRYPTVFRRPDTVFAWYTGIASGV